MLGEDLYKYLLPVLVCTHLPELKTVLPHGCRGLVQTWPPTLVRTNRKVSWQTDEEVCFQPQLMPGHPDQESL